MSSHDFLAPCSVTMTNSPVLLQMLFVHWREKFYSPERRATLGLMGPVDPKKVCHFADSVTMPKRGYHAQFGCFRSRCMSIM